MLGFALICTSFASVVAQSPTPVPVLTWRYDLTHAGDNTQETALTQANVNPQSFGKLFSLPVDSTVYAQPLYVPALKMSDGLVHNVLFVATENDSIYAFDADSNGGANAKPIWQVSLLTAAYGAGAGATAVPWADTGSPDVAPTVGITGTPTINSATNTMYVVANTKENGVYFSRLHAINIMNGTEQANSPVNITATAAGTGAGSSGGQITFSPLWQNQRTALNYYNGYVYFGYAAHGDLNNWHGWLFAYDATTLKQSAALCLSPNDIGAGVWGSGAGMPIDTNISGGRMFVVTGNGARSNPPFNASTDFGQSVIAFNLANGALTPTDSFTSFNYLTLNTEDWDQGAGGVLMLPDQPGSYPHVLVTAGKEGRITVLNRDNLGGLVSGASSNTNALQDISGVISQGQGFWGTGAYWNGNVYVWAGGDNPGTPNAGMLFKMNNGVMDTEPDSETTSTSKFPGPTFSISSNGTQDGIAWAVQADQFNTNGPAVLYAFDATDLSDILYESDTNATRDSAGPANKFSVPVVTNGKVYVAAHGEVDVYGLLNAAASAAAPVINPNGGTFSTSQSVQISSSTPSASIFYTLDGSTPTPTSTQYTAPITISTDTTIKAIASAPGYGLSSVASATFTITQPSFTLTGGSIPAIAAGGSATSTITITPAGGFTGSVSLSCAITSSPAGAVAPPTCNVSQPASISGAQAVTSKLTINTTAASAAALHNPLRPFVKIGEGTLVAIPFFWLPFRRRRWQTMLGLLLLATLASVACGCGGVTKTPSPTQGSGGTTAGAYSITVTGTSGSMQSTTNLSVTVQ
ncbi:MAG: chitobiase/beta-hexosaminidase C-terminal domain-containing protein [Terracidiphilus sp.]